MRYFLLVFICVICNGYQITMNQASESVPASPSPSRIEEYINNLLADELIMPGNTTTSLDYEDESSLGKQEVYKRKKGSLVVALTVCNSRLDEALNSIKSMLLFSKAMIHLLIFSENHIKTVIEDTLDRWQHVMPSRFYYEMLPLVYPAADAYYWKGAYANCTGLKLYFPDMLGHALDALIYVDTDTVFLGPVEDLWLGFARLRPWHVAALAAEHNAGARAWAWYPRHAKHPFYGDYGLNSGVILMNLTRMRDFGWRKHVNSAFRKWRHRIIYPDQDIINIIFDYQPMRVMELPCRFNYRPDVPCAGAAQAGVLLLHGNRGVFHSAHNNVFKAVYRAVAGYAPGSEPLKTFLPDLKAFVANASRISMILGAETDSDTTNNLVPTVNAATRRSGKTLNFEGRYQVWLNQLKMQTTPWMVRYSPYFGYEPYWVGGDWLLIHDDKVSTTRLDASGNPIKPISPPDVCGNECEFMFWRYGKICATTLSSIIWYWTGRDEQWHTFDSYCHLQAWNCKQHYKETTYAFSHLGQCENETYLIPMDPWMRWDRDTHYFDTIRSHNATEELLKQLESNLAKYNKTVIFTYPSTLATVRG